VKPQLKEGQKFGRLTVIRYMTKGQYECSCACGNLTQARGWALKSGRHMSCGCLMRELQANRLRKPGFSALDNEIFRNYKAAAKRRGYDFKLSKSDFVRMLHANCFYCGVEPLTAWIGTKRKVIDTSSFKYNGVDRRSNDIGYTPENCVPCCKICNQSKHTLSEDVWFSWIKKIAGFNKSRFND